MKLFDCVSGDPVRAVPVLVVAFVIICLLHLTNLFLEWHQIMNEDWEDD